VNLKRKWLLGKKLDAEKARAIFVGQRGWDKAEPSSQVEKSRKKRGARQTEYTQTRSDCNAVGSLGVEGINRQKVFYKRGKEKKGKKTFPLEKLWTLFPATGKTIRSGKEKEGRGGVGPVGEFTTPLGKPWSDERNKQVKRKDRVGGTKKWAGALEFHRTKR